MDGGGSALYPNVTEPLSDCKDHDKVHRLHLVWHSLVFLLGLSLNSTALWVFLRIFKLRTVVTIYMVNLAICDLLFTLALPLRIYYYAIDVWPFEDVPCQIAGSLFQINMYGSCLFLASINVDRFLALVYPLKARHLRRPKMARRVCAAIWAVIILGCIPVALIHETSQCRAYNNSVETRCFESFSKATWKMEILPLVGLAEIVGFLLPLGVVLYCSARTLVTLRQKGGSTSRRWQKTINLLLVNALIFVTCFVPYNLVLAAYGLTKAQLVPSTPDSRARLRLALQFTMLLASSNCCLDPLIYYFSTEGFRSTFRSRRPARSEVTGEGGFSLAARMASQGSPTPGTLARQATQRLLLEDSARQEQFPAVFKEDGPGGTGSQEKNGIRESVI